MSPRITQRLKDEVLGVVLATLQYLEQHGQLAVLATVMRKHLIEPYGFPERNNYLDVLKQCFDNQDYTLRAHLGRFNEALNAALQARG